MISFKNIPNILSLTRVVCIPFLILFFYIQHPLSYLITTFLFIFASITDWIDGWMARQYSLQSKFGTFIDPVADKLVVIAIIILLAVELQDIIFTICSIAIVAREIAILALREWEAKNERPNIKSGYKLNVSTIGKSKTFIQMLSLILLLLSRGFNMQIWDISIYTAGIYLFYLATFTTIVSLVSYIFKLEI